MRIFNFAILFMINSHKFSVLSENFSGLSFRNFVRLKFQGKTLKHEIKLNCSFTLNCFTEHT